MISRRMLRRLLHEDAPCCWICGNETCHSTCWGQSAQWTILGGRRGGVTTTTNNDMPNDDNDSTQQRPLLPKFLERILLGEGSGSIGWKVVSFLDPKSMGHLRLTNRSLRTELDTTNCMLRWLEQRPTKLNIKRGAVTIQINVLENEYDYWNCHGLIQKALASGVDPGYRYPIKTQEPPSTTSRENDLYYHYNSKRAERLLLENSYQIEGVLSSNDFITNDEGHQDDHRPKEIPPALPFSLQLAPGWMINTFYRPSVSREKGLARALAILELSVLHIADEMSGWMPNAPRNNKSNDKKKDYAFDSELVLKTIRRLTHTELGQSEPLFQHASYSFTCRRIGEGANKGAFSKRHHARVLQFQTTHGRHPVELVLRLEQNNM